MWKKITPGYASQIRVNRGLYFHHGIYLSDNEVIHYSAQDGDGILDPSRVSIISSTIEEFLKGGILEVREYSVEELAKTRQVDEIAKYAKESLGKKGYDLLNNNCEHFSNECVFGISKSNQVEDILSLLGGLFTKQN